jgi:hypothetical protein
MKGGCDEICFPSGTIISIIFSYCCNKSLFIQLCLITFQAKFPVGFFAPPYLNCLDDNLLPLYPSCSEAQRNILVSSQNRIQLTAFLESAILKPFLVLHTALFDLSSFSPSKFLCLSAHLPLCQHSAVTGICIIILFPNPCVWV